jgi:hypothetical protein
MPTKKNTNKLSQIYKNIDQRELSEQAKDALSKLRMATGNFRKQEGKEADAFMLFYNRLVSKKPTAVKTTPEYKAMFKERQRENARKMLEAKKAKQESRQGQGSEKDAARPAKPFGWRLKGKHNYRKPTREDIRTGKAYYEARINRADTKRTKFPMLERGGYMEHGGDVDRGGMIYALREFVSSGEIANKTDVLNYDDIAKIRRIAIQYYMDNGDVPYSFGELNRIMDYANDKFKSGMMANGGEMDDEEGVDLFEDYEDQPEEVRNILAKYEAEENDYAVLDEMLAELEEIGYTFEYDLGGEPYDLRKIGQTGKSEYYAKGGGIKYSTYDNKSMEYIEGEIAHTERRARQFQQMGDYESMEDRKEHVKKLREIYNRKRAESKMAKGGMTDHNLMIGDTIKQSFGNVVVVENDGKTYVVNINTGQRWTDSEWWSLSKGETTKYTKMAKGGEVFYKESHKMGH